MPKTSFVSLLADKELRDLDLCKGMGVYWDTHMCMLVHTKVTLLLFEIYCAFIAEWGVIWPTYLDIGFEIYREIFMC